MNQEHGIEKIMSVIKRLLGPEGCPWDREQTPDSLCDYLIEETFELVSAIHSQNIPEIVEEMGDVFFLLLFISSLYEKEFTLNEVWMNNSAKMISRHPHVFDGEHFATREDLLRNWEKAKKREKADKSLSPFDSIPRNLPPLLLAYRINSKAARTGFTWSDVQAVEKKLKEEWQEFLEARSMNDEKMAEKEFGDYLFTLVEFGRRNRIKANTALSMANSKFLDRVSQMENLALARGLDIWNLDMEEMDALWEEVKSTKH